MLPTSNSCQIKRNLRTSSLTKGETLPSKRLEATFLPGGLRSSILEEQCAQQTSIVKAEPPNAESNAIEACLTGRKRRGKSCDGCFAPKTLWQKPKSMTSSAASRAGSARCVAALSPALLREASAALRECRELHEEVAKEGEGEQREVAEHETVGLQPVLEVQWPSHGRGGRGLKPREALR